eukprot:Gb_16572 [translate_table: standard]
MGKILQQDKPRNGEFGTRSARRGVRRSREALVLPATKSSEMHQQDQAVEGPPHYKHIERNEFLHRGHKKQKEEDIPVCVCKYVADDPESVCGERCLNVLTSTECTPGYCPCGDHCKNQRFQRCEYIKSKLFKTDGRGWGLLADQDVKAGQFIIEYCGEVISCKEARRRSQAYEAEGLKDAFIICLNRSESIDATRKGSLARFVNHSCEPNCETRKWTVLGEIRVGIFAKQDIPAGTELAYDYNFEWYGGAKVRCRCGAASCFGFLGAKSRGFQKDAYLWEDDDERYSVENVPLYDSEEDEPLSNFLKRAKVCKKLKIAAAKGHFTSQPVGPVRTFCHDSLPSTVDNEKEKFSCHISVSDNKSTLLALAETAIWDEKQGLSNGALDEKAPAVGKEEKVELSAGMETDTLSIEQCPASKRARIGENELVETGLEDCLELQFHSPNKKSQYVSCQKSKHFANKRVNAELIGQILPSKEAREEILAAEEAKIATTAELNSFYDQVRPVIQEHGKDGQDNVPTNYAEKWIQASCEQLKATFDVHFSIVKHLTNNVHGICGEGVNFEHGQENAVNRGV